MARKSEKEIAQTLLLEMIDHTIEDVKDETYTADIKDVSGQATMAESRVKGVQKEMLAILKKIKKVAEK